MFCFHGLSTPLFGLIRLQLYVCLEIRRERRFIVIRCPAASLHSVRIRRHRSPMRGIIAVISGKAYWTFVVHARSHFQDCPVQVSWTQCSGFCQPLIVHDLLRVHGRLIQQRLKFHRCLVVTGRVALSEFPENESRYHFHDAFFIRLPACYTGCFHSLLVNRNDHAWAAGLCVWGAPPASAANGAAVNRLLGEVLRLCDVWKVRRVQFFLVAEISAAVPFIFTNDASAAEPKRILPAHSFSGAALPFTVHSFE